MAFQAEVEDIYESDVGMAKELIDEVKRLKAEVESLKKDAARYRWITDGSRGDYCWNNVLSEKDRDGGDTLDDAIDEAMSNKE